MKKFYENPEMNLSMFADSGIVTASGGEQTTDGVVNAETYMDTNFAGYTQDKINVGQLVF